MRRLLIAFLVLLLGAACAVPQPSPTPDVEATVAARVATQLAERQIPTPTSTPSPTATPPPTATSAATIAQAPLASATSTQTPKDTPGGKTCAAIRELAELLQTSQGKQITLADTALLSQVLSLINSIPELAKGAEREIREPAAQITMATLLTNQGQFSDALQRLVSGCVQYGYLPKPT